MYLSKPIKSECQSTLPDDKLSPISLKGLSQKLGNFKVEEKKFKVLPPTNLVSDMVLNHFKVINIVLSITLFVTVSSCQKREIMLPDPYIRQLSSGSFKIPSIHSFDILFVLTDGDRIARTNVNTLHVVYISLFKSDFSNFYEFLLASLNQRIVIPEKLLAKQQVEFFVLDKAVSSDFENGSLPSFLNKYVSPRCVQGYSLKHNPLDSGAIYTVLYYLFTSNFKVQPVDSEESFLFVQM